MRTPQIISRNANGGQSGQNLTLRECACSYYNRKNVFFDYRCVLLVNFIACVFTHSHCLRAIFLALTTWHHILMACSEQTSTSTKQNEFLAQLYKFHEQNG